MIHIKTIYMRLEEKPLFIEALIVLGLLLLIGVNALVYVSILYYLGTK